MVVDFIVIGEVFGVLIIYFYSLSKLCSVLWVMWFDECCIVYYVVGIIDIFVLLNMWLCFLIFESYFGLGVSSGEWLVDDSDE